MGVHIPTVAVPYEACRTGGSLPSTAASARASRPPRRLRHKRKYASNLRHRRCVPSGRGSRAQRPRCLTDTSGSATAPAHGRSNPAPGEAARNPYRIAVDHSSGEARSEQSPHLNEAVKAAVETAQFLDRRVVHSPDGILDARNLAPDGCDGLGLLVGLLGGGGADPVSQDRPCAFEFPPTACDPGDLDRQALLPQRFP